MSYFTRRLPVLLGGGKTYQKKMVNLFGSAIVAYWPMTETTGTVATDVVNAQNGAFSNVTLAAAAGPYGSMKLAPQWVPASDSYANIYTAALTTNFNRAEGCLMLWAKVRVGTVWTDGTLRTIAFIGADGNNRVLINKSSANNTIIFEYKAGATSEYKTFAQSDTGWLHCVLNWSLSGDVVRYYINTVQQGDDNTGVGTWAVPGNLATTTCCIGAATTTGTQPFDGYIYHVILLNRPATVPEIAKAYTGG